VSEMSGIRPPEGRESMAWADGWASFNNCSACVNADHDGTSKNVDDACDSNRPKNSSNRLWHKVTANSGV